MMNGNVHPSPMELVVLQRAGPSITSQGNTVPRTTFANAWKRVLKQESAKPALLSPAWTSEQERESEAKELQQALSKAIDESDSEDQEETRALLSELNDLLP